MSSMPVRLYSPSVDGETIKERKIRVSDTCKFILKSSLKFGLTFDYGTCFAYSGADKEIILRCRKQNHMVRVKPSYHFKFKSSDCPRCNGFYVRNANEFMEDSKLVHGEKYDYSNMGEFDGTKYVNIRCMEHDHVFTQAKPKHLNGQGCPKCIGRHKTTEQFIEEATSVHYGKYDYSKSVYTGSDSKIKVICPYHGEFEQNAYYHLHGCGCGKCARESASNTNINNYKDINGTLYFIKIHDLSAGECFYKIGITTKSIRRRFKDKNFKVTDVIYQREYDIQDCIHKEDKILKILKHKRFKVRNMKNSNDNGWSECFRTKDLKMIDMDCLVSIV